MTAQVTWDTFVPRPSEGPRIIHLHDIGPYEACTTAQDAEIIVRDIGKMPGGGTTCDRLMDCGKVVSSDTMDPTIRELHYWSHNTRGYEKVIRYDGTIIDYAEVRTTRHDYQRIPVIGARIEGQELILETEGKDYGLEFREAKLGTMCNFIDEPYDPSFFTEHLFIHSLNHGKTPQDIRRYISNASMPWSLQCFKPWTHDNETGEIIPNPRYDRMLEFAKSVGIIPKVRYDVQPYRPWVLPSVQWKYCIRKKICGKSKIDCGTCHQFIGDPEQKVEAKDCYNYDGKKSKVPKRYAEAVA